VQLFLHIHTAARRLLAVTKRGVEDSDALPIHGFRTSVKVIYLLYRRMGAKEKLIIFTEALAVMIVLDTLM
jgi:hypothetical protein